MKPQHLLACLLLAVCCAANSKTETGDINGAKFRIDLPEHWNGGLVMYCHGYASMPVSYDDPKLPPALAVFIDEGYAVAQSGYAATGWAVEQAVVDIENLRRYFIAKYGAVKETYITGHSMGGFLTMMIMETNPLAYDAGLPLCGPLAPANHFMSRGAFDARVVFDYYFPGGLPDPAKVDRGYEDSKDAREHVLQLLDGAPDKAAVLRRMIDIKSNQDLAGVLSFITSVLKELQQRAGGNPFDNTSIIYTGSPDDAALNAGVKRYRADPKAAAYVRQFYTPTGLIRKPMLAVHTVYDPLVSPAIPNVYQSLVEQAGAANWYVQQYVRHDGHCAIEPGEIARAFSELREWKTSGVRPQGGELTAPARAASDSGR
jgi:pimeloyl-ACP methyl ester carboxylesterase